MINLNETKIEKTSPTTLLVTRTFNAPLSLVWSAWTQQELLDQWWAPKPWITKTKSMDFSEGGLWLYAMCGPEGEIHWCRIDYKTITKEVNFTAKDAFCDENGTPNTEIPGMNWSNTFSPTGDTTDVSVEITFVNETALEQIIEMGFKEGFTMAHGNLDELLLSLK